MPSGPQRRNGENQMRALIVLGVLVGIPLAFGLALHDSPPIIASVDRSTGPTSPAAAEVTTASEILDHPADVAHRLIEVWNSDNISEDHHLHDQFDCGQTLAQHQRQ